MAEHTKQQQTMVIQPLQGIPGTQEHVESIRALEQTVLRLFKIPAKYLVADPRPTTRTQLLSTHGVCRGLF